MAVRNNDVLAAYQAVLIMEPTQAENNGAITASTSITTDTNMSDRVTAINFRGDKGTIPTTSIQSKVATERPVINRRSADITFLASDENLSYLARAETDAETIDYRITYYPNGNTGSGKRVIKATGFLRSDNRMVAATSGQNIQTSWHLNQYEESVTA